MENIAEQTKTNLRLADNTELQSVTVIPVVEESFAISKEMIATSKIRIAKTVTEHQTEINIPLITEEYEINRVPINQVVLTQPAAMRQEGDKTIISVVKEVLVVEKRFEIIEELHIVKRTTEKTEIQQITLRQEQVQIERTPVISQGNNA